MAVMTKVLNSKNKINLVVSFKQPRPQFYSPEEAEILANEGLKIIDWASTCENSEPDIVFAAAGTEPNLEALAAITILREAFPKLKIRFINVVDLLKLRHPRIDERGLTDEEFDAYFTKDKPVIFAFHGFEGLIRDIFFDRHNHQLYIHGYRENGDITTPFDMRVLSELDRFHLAKEAASIIYAEQVNDFCEKMDIFLDKHHKYIRENGTDIPEVSNWHWSSLGK
jgi:xylulose-5-phosphate/fructose-6-phosphate phosphoketolase